jgi:hypothetical protein
MATSATMTALVSPGAVQDMQGSSGTALLNARCCIVSLIIKGLLFTFFADKCL